ERPRPVPEPGARGPDQPVPQHRPRGALVRAGANAHDADPGRRLPARGAARDPRLPALRALRGAAVELLPGRGPERPGVADPLARTGQAGPHPARRAAAVRGRGEPGPLRALAAGAARRHAGAGTDAERRRRPVPGRARAPAALAHRPGAGRRGPERLLSRRRPRRAGAPAARLLPDAELLPARLRPGALARPLPPEPDGRRGRALSPGAPDRRLAVAAPPGHHLRRLGGGPRRRHRRVPAMRPLPRGPPVNPPWSAGNGSGPGGPAEPIVLERVSKWYRRRDRRAMLAMSLYRRLTGALTPGFWALSDVSLAVRAGEALGIVGPNGAGKTTLLKVIAGITHPTSGRVAVRAHVSTHLGVGSGFQQYLTGRDNVFLQGSILGLTNRQIASRFDAIVALAGIETAVDQPLWTYSAGMTTRLGFAVAAHVDFDVL